MFLGGGNCHQPKTQTYRQQEEIEQTGCREYSADWVVLSLEKKKIAGTYQDDMGKNYEKDEDIQIALGKWEIQAQRQAGDEGKTNMAKPAETLIPSQ